MRKLCTFALPCAVGILAAVCFLPEGLLLPGALVCVLAAALGMLLRGDRRLRMVLIALGLAAGLAWTAVYGMIFYAPARWLAGTQGTFTATVTTYPADTRYGCSLQATLHTGRGPDVHTLLYASDEAFSTLVPGDRITFPAQLRLADTAYGEQTDTYRAKGIYLIASAQGAPTLESSASGSIRYWPVVFAQALKDSVSRCFDQNTAPLITALLTGDKSALPGTLYSALQRTGLAHTVAVSGLHVSFLAGLVVTLLGQYRRRTAVVGLILLCFFAAVAGATPSVIRAVILQALLLLAPLVGREYDRATALSAGLLLLLLWRPYAVASVSLQLSFASVAGIYLVAGPLFQTLTARLPRQPASLPGRLGCAAGRFCAASLSTTAGALLFTTPLTAWYFGTLSLIAPLSNLLCLWAVSLAFLGGLLTALVGLILPALGQGLALFTCLPAVYLQIMAGLLARFPFASVGMEELYLPLWLLLVYAVVVLCLLRPRQIRRPAIPLAACAAALCVALVCTGLSGARGAVSLSVLDVGQGQSVLIHSGGHNALVDCGGSGLTDPGDVAADGVQRMGATRLDLLILTHCHADHAGGVPQLFARLKVDTLLLPRAATGEEEALREEILSLARQAGTRVVEVDADLTVTLGRAELSVFAPLGSGSTNEAGLSLLCTAGDFAALITGDMDAQVEQALLGHTTLPTLDLLVVGHHGGATSTSEQLLQTLRPKYAVISVGYNSYGHPAQQVLLRLKEAGCAVYRTDWMGTVRVTAQG